MAGSLHGSARTTPRVRAEIQASQEATSILASRYGLSRTVKEATIKAFHYPDLESLKTHVLAFVSAHNFAKHLKAFRWRTSFEAVCHAWTTTPDVLKLNPRHLIPGPNTGCRPASHRRPRPHIRREFACSQLPAMVHAARELSAGRSA